MIKANVDVAKCRKMSQNVAKCRKMSLNVAKCHSNYVILCKWKRNRKNLHTTPYICFDSTGYKTNDHLADVPRHAGRFALWR